MEAIIFDFDGVIHNTFEFHFKRVKEFTGIDFSEEEFKDMHNGNFFKNKNGKFSHIDWSGYRDYIYQDFSSLKITDQIKNVLFKLHENYKLFIISSGGTECIKGYLKNNKIEHIFHEVLGFESHPYKVDKFNLIFEKYSFDPRVCLFVTDTLGDVLEANEVGLKSVAVDFGYHGKKTLEKGCPYCIISKFEDVFNALDGSSSELRR